MKKIILNQKSYLTYDEMLKYKSEFSKFKSNKYELVLFPPVLYLSMFKDYSIPIGSQNFYSSKEGSFTGEINLEALKSIGATYTMVANHDRRKYNGETSSDSKEKLFKSLNAKFNTLLYVGEVKKNNIPFTYIKRDLHMYLKNIDKNSLKYLSIVYEPNWSIGNCEIQDVNKIAKIIRRIKIYIKNIYGIDMNVYYGGRVNSDNINEIFEICDGIVLGKVSTNIKDLKNLLSKIY